MEGVSDRVDEELVVRAGFVIPADAFTVRFSRSSGPGGQGVNTTDSRVELSFDVARSRHVPDHLRERLLTALAARLVDGVLTAKAAEFRAQLRNRQAARDRLAAWLRDASAPPPPPRRKRRVPRGVVERRLKNKHHRSATKQNRRLPSGND